VQPGRVQAGQGFRIEADVGEIDRERRDAGRPFAQAIEVVGGRDERAAATGLPARQLGPVVGESGRDLEAHAAVGLDEVEHPRTRPHERLDHFVVHGAVGLRTQITQRVGLSQFATGRTVMGGDPHDAAGHRGGAAHRRRLLEDLHRRPGDRCRQSGCQPRAPRTEYDDIDFLVP
jgi:hypothetical protein